MPSTPANAQIKACHCGIEYATCSDIGLKRSINQDAYGMRLADSGSWEQDGHLFIVADGMGAHVAGEYASRLAVEEVEAESSKAGEQKSRLTESLQRANGVIFEKGQSNPQLYNMGTTCSTLWLLPSGALLGHVGDSRVYRARGEHIKQLTFDHSLVWEMRAAGQISSTNQSVPRNVITRCLGPHPHVDVDLEGPFSVRVGDTFLLCSDGLTGRISDEEIGVALRYLGCQDAAEFLVDLANLRGGQDNITVSIVGIKDVKVESQGKTVDKIEVDRGTHPVLWLAAGLGVILGLIALQTQLAWVGAAGATLFLVSGISLILQWVDSRKGPSSGRLVSAPYASAKTELNDDFVARIVDTFEVSLDGLESSEGDIGELRSAVGSLSETNETDPTSRLTRIRELASRLRVRQTPPS